MLACAQEIEGALESVAEVDPTFMTVGEKDAALMALHRLETRLTALKLRVLAVASDLAETDGSRDAATWLASRVQADPVALRGELELARALDAELPVVARAMEEGVVSVAQARVIAHAIDALPDEAPAETVEQAERWLVDAAGSFNPKQLRVLGRRILDVIDPSFAENAEAKRLAEEEAHAERVTHLAIKPLGDGTTRITALVADAVAHRLRTCLEAFAQPRLANPAAVPVRRARALGEAFGQLLEAFDPHRLPLHGGDATTVMVTIALADLERDLASAELGPDFGGSYGHETTGPGSGGWASGGEKITATQARRLACTAGIIPAVLGGKGEILDLGRTRRLFTPAQRKVLRLRDHHCRAEGCTVPATWCDAHHRQPWSSGGTTDLDDGVLLCGHHHRVIHDPAYEHTWLPDGRLRYHRRR